VQAHVVLVVGLGEEEAGADGLDRRHDGCGEDLGRGELVEVGLGDALFLVARIQAATAASSTAARGSLVSMSPPASWMPAGAGRFPGTSSRHAPRFARSVGAR